MSPSYFLLKCIQRFEFFNWALLSSNRLYKTASMWQCGALMQDNTLHTALKVYRTCTCATILMPYCVKTFKKVIPLFSFRMFYLRNWLAFPETSYGCESAGNIQEGIFGCYSYLIQKWCHLLGTHSSDLNQSLHQSSLSGVRPIKNI